jgi:hypothetical protein
MTNGGFPLTALFTQKGNLNDHDQKENDIEGLRAFSQNDKPSKNSETCKILQVSLFYVSVRTL